MEIKQHILYFVVHFKLYQQLQSSEEKNMKQDYLTLVLYNLFQSLNKLREKKNKIKIHQNITYQLVHLNNSISSSNDILFNDFIFDNLLPHLIKVYRSHEYDYTINNLLKFLIICLQNKDLSSSYVFTK